MSNRAAPPPAGASRLRVSVALGTHNGERFVGEQIESILAQTRPVDEIVLSDDASTDRTVEIVEEAVAGRLAEHGSAPELVVLRNDPPLRVTKNFEQALLRTTGDVVALCDQDDVWHPQRVQRLAAYFDDPLDPDALLVFSNARQVDGAGRSLGHDLFDAIAMSATERELLESGRAFDAFMRRNLATGATVMLRRSLVDEAAPFPDTWLHDEWLAVIAAAHDGVRMHDEQLTDYRQHGGNQVGMTKIGLARKFRMFAQPRTERNRRLYLRARELPAMLDGLAGVPQRYRAAAREKVAFEEARQRYPEARLRRAIPILRQLRLGRYGRYGTGLKDAVRNLLQPV
ncbi:glycosyltransferase family 2 protein [Leucobacter sp. CSA1]|uniref:Glycosyltransferase family 2 protein n=1 Tax=Leucobacter chromiisoli TaxID=2796471 RepID=A0A934Q3A2_9MICO|nr:glycosyltransferase family 2 protein [Leucobacter chromiisoli]MBK0417690.1 glycosyltransferase family 2 protein [Leucobacter chromiisoli]